MKRLPQVNHPLINIRGARLAIVDFFTLQCFAVGAVLSFLVTGRTSNRHWKPTALTPEPPWHFPSNTTPGRP
jgi:hypothetical protein